MSTNPNSGLTGHDNIHDNTHNNTTNEQGGVIPTVLSYVGLGGNNSTTTGTGASDAASEPAFGAAVGPNSNSSAGGLGAGNHNSSSTGGILGGSNSGSSSGGIMGSSNTGSTTSGLSGRGAHDVAPTLNPHDEERARVVAERAMGHGSTTGAGVGGYESGVGAGSGAGLGSGVGLGSGHEPGHHGSGVGSGVGLGAGQHGSDAGLGSGVGLGRDESARHSSGVGSGVGLGSGHDSERHGSGVGPGVGLDSSDKDRHGSSAVREGSTSEEHDSSEKRPVGGGSKGNLENKSAIPTAGGIKLGEKHWGESDIVPEFPKVREEENISSASGQPDKSTRDNTSANTGNSSTIPPTGAGEHGEQKEGMMDKVKDKLHMGGHK